MSIQCDLCGDRHGKCCDCHRAPQLAPCPLLGCKVRIDQPHRGCGRPWNVFCDDCGLVLYGSEGESRTAMILRWNTRVAAKAAGGE